MFGLVLLAAVTVLHVYVLWRTRLATFAGRRVPGRLLLGLGVLLWAGVVLSRTLGHDGDGPVAAALEGFGMTWMVVVFLTATCLLAVDLVTAFGWLFRPWAPRLRGLAVVGGGVLSAVAAVQGARAPVVSTYEVVLPGLPPALDGTTAVALSDLHLGSRTGAERLDGWARQVEALEPDLVLLLGDVFEGHGRAGPELLPALRRLFAPLGVYAVPGNHERHGADADLPLLRAAGHTVLRNEARQVAPGLVVAGVDDLTAARRGGRGRANLEQALCGRPAGATILLSHSPLEAEAAAAGGAGLMLSGHTHAGQVWPFGTLVRLAYPLLHGRYEVDGMTILVSRGAGTWGPRMRLWPPGEIVRVVLRAPRG